MPWKASLVTGETVVLKKDCECVDHEGPHWIHSQKMWAAANAKLKSDAVESGDPARVYYACRGMAIEEVARLDERMRIFERLRIARLFYEQD